MASTKDKINFVTRPVPSGPGKTLITVVGTDCMKGGSPMTSKPPTEYCVPGGDMSKKGKC